ncbi:MAG: DEAD/DEAH box helicase [Crenarchaeota archaeon]|nr:DEAD/DEAH box helicase [Thermoproteota archaeon]
MVFIKIDPKILESSNLLIIAPTGSGKTYNSISSAWKLVQEGKYSRIIILAPTRAACDDIARTARSIAGPNNVGVDTSDARLDPNWRLDVTWSKPVIVTTYERADSIIMMFHEILNDSIIILDEAHNILFPERATAIIDILCHLKMISERARTRIVMLSATMPMIEELKKYLNAEVIALDGRPVELRIEKVPMSGNVFGRGAEPYYNTKYEVLISLLKRLDRSYTPILIYVPCRRMAEKIAERLRKACDRIGWVSEEEIVHHHAGLPTNKRREIENELKKLEPKYRIIIATDTLSQSVNFSFRTVIVLGLKLFLPGEVKYIEPAVIQQVLGRAGRPGYWNVGYGFIIYTSDEEDVVNRALERIYGRLETLGDYYVLPIRLAYSGKSIDIWVRYAPPFIDKSELSTGVEICKKLRLIDEENKLTPLGRVLAREYVPSYLFPLFDFYFNYGYWKELENLNRESRIESALAFVLAVSYLLQKVWTVEKMFDEKKILCKAPPFEYYVPEAEIYIRDIEEDSSTKLYLVERIAKKFNARIEQLVEPDIDAVLYALYNPDILPADQLAETCRKGAQIMRSLAREGLIDQEYDRIGEVLVNIFKSYRRLLRDSDPRYVAKFVEVMFRRENLEKLVKKRLSFGLDQLFIYMTSINTEDVETGIRELLRALRKFNGKRSNSS